MHGRKQESVLAGLLVVSPQILFVLIILKLFLGSKYPKHIKFSFENKGMFENSDGRVAVSFSEAAQEKRVLLLDENFQELQSIPIQIGRRHHNLSLAEAAAPEKVFARGDRVRVDVPPEQLTHADAVAETLRAQGELQ